ncbi:formate/nitrite transporter family protein [Balneolaceae bacterium ANBcel3]|nr:formate/nitrite transporter family protein [Balneolaceae bacterium ANBcel3]
MKKDNINSKKSELRYPVLESDAFSPDQVAKRVATTGVKKVGLPFVSTLALGILGGAFISMGVLYEQVIRVAAADGSTGLSFLAPIMYSMGYMIAFISGAEIFTTNNLAVMGLASKKIKTWSLIKNWTYVLFANAIGAIMIAGMLFYSGKLADEEGALILQIVTASSERIEYKNIEIFFQATFANFLICGGAWVAMAGKTITDKVLALVLPISAVSALGFQHCAGNMMPMFLSLMTIPNIEVNGVAESVTFLNVVENLTVVAAGNILGGAVLVGLIYYLIYIKKPWQ